MKNSVRKRIVEGIFGIIVLVVVVGLVSFGLFVKQKWHNDQIARAEEQYDKDEIGISHFIAKKSYQWGKYEEALSKFAESIEKFPPILYTEDDQDLHAEKSVEVNEAIIKVVLSLRKLNRHNEIQDKVENFKKKFPKSKLVMTLDSDQKSILDWYNIGLYRLYDKRRSWLDYGQMFKRWREEALSYTLFYINLSGEEKASAIARKTPEETREAFNKILDNKLLNEAPYSELRGEALYFIAKSFLIEENYTQAYQEFDKIATREFYNYPNLQEDAMYNAAYCLKKRSIYDEAFGRYTEFMLRFPNSEYVTDAYFDLGEIYAQRKEYGNARDSYKNALQRAKDQNRKVEDFLKKGRSSYQDGNSEQDKDNAKKARDAYENAARIYRGLSAEYLKDSFFTKALNFISEFPRKPEDWSENIGEKITEYEHFVRKYGQDREAKFQAAIGHAYYDEGNEGNGAKARDSYKRAIGTYKVILDKYPESDPSPETKLLIANIHNHLYENSESIKAYKRVIDDHEDDYGKQQVDTSVTIKRSPKRTDRYALCAYEIGEAYFAINDFEKALEWYMKIVTEKGFKDDDNVSDTLKTKDFRRDELAPDALYGAMKALSKMGRNDELENIAITYIEDLRKDKPFLSAEAQINFAHIKRVELNQPKKAAPEYKKLNAKFEVNKDGKVSGYLPDPDLRFNLIKLQGKYYEGLCYETDDDSKTSGIEAYSKVAMLFQQTFQPLIDAPNIDVPNSDYYVPTALWYAGLANYDLAEALNKRKNSDEMMIYFKNHDFYIVSGQGEPPETREDTQRLIQELVDDFYSTALKAFEDLTSHYSKSKYAEDAADQIKKLRQKLGNKIGKELDKADASGNPNSSKNPQIQGQLTSEQIAKKASDSTVFLVMDNSTGSGFFVGPGQVATNFHVIAGATSGYAHLISKKLRYAIVGVVASDEERDLAILKVRAFDVPPLPRGNSAHVKVGETVYTAGSPKGWVDTISDGIISRVLPVRTISFRSGQKYTGKQIQISAPTSPGSSGGPLLNSKGKVIGICHAKDLRYDAENINFAIPVNYLEALIKRVGPPKPLNDL